MLKLSLRRWVPSSRLNKRYATLSQTTAALRPFFFSVHPDLFGKFPRERAINEASLKLLSEHLEHLHTKKPGIAPKRITFYVRNTSNVSASGQNIRQVNISLLSTNLRETVEGILKSCDLSCDSVEELDAEDAEFPRPVDWDPSFYRFYGLNYSSGTAKKVHTPAIRTWMRTNVPKAIDQQLLNKPLVYEAARMCSDLCAQFGLTSIRWDSGWNYTQFLACLGVFQRMMAGDPLLAAAISGKTLIFGPTSGVNIHGEIMLSSEDVPQYWSQVLSNLDIQLATLTRLLSLEENLSTLLKGMQVSRDKQRVHLLAFQYEQQLSHLLQALSIVDLYRLPQEMDHLHLVIESAGSSLFLDTSGDFRVPHTHPAGLVVDFISQNAYKAAFVAEEMCNNKNSENQLVKSCKCTYRLRSLRKDSNVSVVQMIKSCEDLLDNPYEIQVSLEGCSVVVSTYYTVMQNGDIYIPWNWAESVR